MTKIYNTIGLNYNNTRKPDPYICEKIFSYLKPLPKGLYLDIGCGTGSYTMAPDVADLQSVTLIQKY